jgi:hypothetical protein
MDQYEQTESGADGCFLYFRTTDPMHSSEPLTVAATRYKTASANVRTGIRNQVIVTLVPSDSPAASQVQVLTPDHDKNPSLCGELK